VLLKGEYMGDDSLPALADSEDEAKNVGMISPAQRLFYRLAAVPPEVPIFLFYLGVAILVTWPLVGRFNSTVYGYPGDNLGAIWINWWTKSAASFGGKPSFTPLAGFPFGTSTGFPLEFLGYLEMRFLLLLTSSVVAWNIDIFLSFVLSGVTMYYLVRYLTRDRRVAFFGGFVYMIGVFHAFNSMVIGGALSATQWMPLYVLVLLKFVKKPTLRYAVFLGLSAVLVVGTSIHYGLFMGIFTIAFLVGRFVYSRVAAARRGGRLPSGAFSVNRRTAVLSLSVFLVVMAFVTPLLILYARDSRLRGQWPASATSVVLRTSDYVEAGAARPVNYVIPSMLNPVFGSSVKKTAGDYFPNFGNAIYIGWTVILLALVWVVALLRKWLRNRKSSPGGDEDTEMRGPGRDALETNGRLWGFAAAGLAAFLLSLKPSISVGSVKIPLPSELLRIFVPWFRWYNRLSIVVSLCLIVIACFGLKWLFSKVRGRGLRIAGIALLVCLATIEMTLVPPSRSFSFENTPAVFKSVSKLGPDSALVFYPLMEAGYFQTSRLLFYQTGFQKPMLNGGRPNTDGEAMRRTVYNPYNPDTPPILKRLGITNMVFFEGQVEGVGGQRQDASLLPAGFHQTARFFGTREAFEKARLYSVDAAPADFVPLYLGDISLPYVDEGGVTVKLLGVNNVLKILNYSGHEAKVTVRLPLTNPFSQREVLIKDSQGRTLWSGLLRQGQASEAEIRDLVLVPSDGSDLHIVVRGPSYTVSPFYTALFGVSSATLESGDARITESR
jgi:hypothetical protein